MAQTIALKNPFTSAEVVTLTAEIVTAHVIVDPLVTPLTESQDAGLITVSTEKEAVIKEIALMGDSYPELFPVDTTAAQLAAMRQEAKDCEKLGAAYGVLSTTMFQRAKIIRNNIMVICTEILNNGKLAAKKSTGIKDMVKAIVDAFYKRGTKKAAVSRTMGESSSTIIGGVKTGSIFVNTGKGILGILNVGGNIADMMKINPSSSGTIPKTWTNIVVTNLSATDPGSFDVFMK